MKSLTGIAAALLIVAGCANVQNEVGKPYRGWKHGEFDIHHIHTGMGESNLLIMPDGTTMLIDAGDLGPNDPEAEMPRAFPPIADAEFHPGKYIARYVMHVNPNGENVDYFMASHFHGDHLSNSGGKGEMTQGRNPDYRLTGVTEAGEWLRFSKFYDRGWPGYDYPVHIDNIVVSNFRDFVKYHSDTYGAVQEEFKVGELNQIGMVHEPKKYSALFSIRNIAANGEIWTGNGTETIRYYDLNSENSSGWQNENSKSIVMRIDYGPFSYYTGGDIAGSVLNEKGEEVYLEEKAGEACGEVDVCKTNHHAYKDAMREGFVKAVNPDHYVSCAWDIWHTQPQLMERMIGGNDGMIFHQFVWPEFLEGHEDASWYDRLYKEGGHIVVKAYDKGRNYLVYILDSTNEDMIVKDIFGPYSAE